jgi:hypothetical protein
LKHWKINKKDKKMQVTYTWKVTAIKTATVEELDDFVIHVRWNKIGTDELGNQGTFAGATPLTTTVDSEGQFIPFDQLTESVVLGWIQAIVVGSYEEHVNGQIERQINEKINKVAEPALPWDPTPTPPAT